MKHSTYEWDDDKNIINQEKHGVSFEEAQYAFDDPFRVILNDPEHGDGIEDRFFCLGKVDGAVMTVRFTYRRKRIRIFGAGYWRQGKKRYEKDNNLHG
jgi:uncharacterized DUF497 family protein